MRLGLRLGGVGREEDGPAVHASEEALGEG
jgi:hypothetical protein